MDEQSLSGKNILVVDDEVDLRDIVASELEFMGARVERAENIKVAKEFLAQHKFDLVVSDIRMPGGTGIDLLEYVKAENVMVPSVVLITGFADIAVEDAFNRGAEALMSKPFKLDDLILTVSKFTRPLKERFTKTQVTPLKHLDLKFDCSFEDKIKKLEFALGRGGFSLQIDTQSKKIEVNEAIDFTFCFTDREFKGQAVCRWLRYSDQFHRAVVGFEFEELSPETLDFLSGFIEKESPVAFIPIMESIT